MSYYQLTENERYQIYTLKKAGHSQKEIAGLLDRCPSTISRELTRNSGLRGYRPKQAEHLSVCRRRGAPKARKMTETVITQIKTLLRQELSPQQVVDYLAKHTGVSLHHETVYQLIYRDKANGGDLACVQQDKTAGLLVNEYEPINARIGVIVFGSDQGMVGQFNETMVEFVVDTLEKLPGEKILWPVGESLQSRFKEADLVLSESFILPNSINAITPLVGKILIEVEAQREQGAIEQVYLFHHRPQQDSTYHPICQQLLPLDKAWQNALARIPWPSNNLPEVMPDPTQTLRALVREYLFVSLFRACAESLASENASRLIAMQRAEKNIDELQENLKRTFNRIRQSGIDEELFDVISGFEALSVFKTDRR